MTEIPQDSASQPRVCMTKDEGPQKVVYEQFMLFGDSITQGDGNPELTFSCYQSLQHDYIRRVDIVNRGFSGHNTTNALSILPKIFPSPQEARVRLVTIFFGANDVSLPNTTGQHVPIDKYIENLGLLISNPAIQLHKDIRVLLITPPPIDEWGFDLWDEPGRSARKAVVAKQYAEAVCQVGQERGVAVVDLWSACMLDVGWKEGDTWDEGTYLPGDKRAGRHAGLARLLPDGLHLSGDGYKVLYQEMKKVIAARYPELRPQCLPVALEPFFPEWFEVVPNKS